MDKREITNSRSFIGVDIGGTQMRAAVVNDGTIGDITSCRVVPGASAVEVTEQLFSLLDGIITPAVEGIGIGVPGLVDRDRGIVFDVVNILSWKEIPLRHLVEERYHLRVLINNDANCFAVGEYHYGKGRGDSMVGITVGTGLGTGIIINGRLYSGRYCGAGEFGMIEYRDNSLEYYASGQYFSNIHGIDGDEVFRNAEKGDARAAEMYSQFGRHLGSAVKILLYALEPEQIVIGGSVKKAWKYFQSGMVEELKSFAYSRPLETLEISVSELDNSGILGAAALHLDIT